MHLLFDKDDKMSTRAEDLKQKGRVDDDLATPPAPPPRSDRRENRPPELPVLSLTLPLYKEDTNKQNEAELTSPLASPEGFSPVSLQNDERQKLHLTPSIENALKKHLPLGYQLRMTPNNNDSWWESTAHGLNYLLNNDKAFNVESLRSMVSDLARNKRPDWLTPELLQDYEQTEDFYLTHISDSVAQMKEQKRKANSAKNKESDDAIPGGYIEARLLCNHLPINIHWIIIDDLGNITEQLSNSEGTYEYTKEDQTENDTNIVHLVISNNHVVPAINFDKTASVDPDLITAIQDFCGNTKHKFDRSKRLSGQFEQKSPVVKALTEIFETEKKYHENLRHFALEKLPGKKAKTKKTLWESFVSLLPFNDADDADEKVTKTLQNDWPEIKKMANDHSLNEALSFIDDFVSNYTNPNLAEKEIVYSAITVKKVRRYWQDIKAFLQGNIDVNKIRNMDEFIQESIADNLPGGWVRIKEILEENKLLTDDITVKFLPFIAEYNQVAKNPHAFSMIDNLEFYNKEKLEQEGFTEQNVEEWVNIIYDSIIGSEVTFTTVDHLTNEKKTHVKRGNTFINNIFPQMVAVKEYYYLMLEQQNYLMENLKEDEVKSKINGVDDAYFRMPQGYSVEAYLNSILISVVQRIGRYEGLIANLQKVLPSNHPAQHKLVQIHQRCSELNLMANELPKNLEQHAKIKSTYYKFDKPYSGYGVGNNYAAISYMVKLTRLINCWQNNALGREILIPRFDKLDEEFKKAENEFNNAKAAFDRIKKDKKIEAAVHKQAEERVELASKNFAIARANSFEFKSIRSKIAQSSRSEQFYVDDFQNFLQQLFIDSKQYFNDPITERIDTKIDAIVKKIGSSESIFANSLLNIKRQFRNKFETEGVASPAFPLDMFNDSYISNNQAQPTSQVLMSAKEPLSSPKLNQSARAAGQYAEEELRNAKLAQHFMRLTIINRVKMFFRKFDLQTQAVKFIKPASDSIQYVSYRIQQELDELSKLSPDQYEKDFGTKSDKEVIGEVIIKIIRPHLEVAGILKDSFLTGSFGNILSEATDYLNHINKINKTSRQMFVQNPLPIRDTNSATPTFDDRPTHKKIFAFYANLNMITDYYCCTGLGLHIAESAGIKPNTKFRHLDIIQKLALLTERMALDPRSADCTKVENEAQAKELLKEILGKLKKEIIDEFPDHPSRVINELIHLYNYFAQNSGLDELKERDSRRFENHKLITNYQIATPEAQNYINKHIAQTYAKAVLDYSIKIDSRVFVETAVCKEEVQKEILKIINDIYGLPVAICQKQINELPEPPRNISSLIRYKITEYVQKSLSRKSIYAQGALGEMLHAVESIHEQLKPSLIIPRVASTSELAPLLVTDNKSAPSTPRTPRIPLTNSMMESNFGRTIATPAKAKTPARTPAGKVARHKTVSVYSSLPLQFSNGNSNELLAKQSLTCLVSQILTLSHIYCHTDIGEEICKEIHLAPNKKQGQSDFAKKLAGSAMEIFLADEADTTTDVKRKENNSREREKQLHNKMIEIINNIRGSGKGIENFTHSPDSRFAQALVELLPKDTPHALHRNIKDPFQMSLIKGYKKTAHDAKHFIHQVAIIQSCKQFEDLEESLMGKFKKTAGDPQQIAAHKIHLELKKLSTLSLDSCEIEIAKLDPSKGKNNGKSIRDLIFNKLSNSIVFSGAMAGCIFDGPFGNKLLNVANSLCNTQHTKPHDNFLRKVFTPNHVRRYPDTSKLISNSPKQTKLAICGRLLMLSDFYLDKPLGRQVADKAAQKSGNGATYNEKQKGWMAQAEKIKAIATGFYFGKHNDNESTINAIQDVLNHLKIIIAEIRSSGKTGKHSRFVNELIRIIEDYGNEHGLNVKPGAKINERYLFNNAKDMFSAQISSENHEDYIHMHVIQNAAAELVKTKNDMNNQRWTPFSDKETLKIAEENLDKLFKAGIKERRDLMTALPKGQQDICALIREKIKDKIPLSFWTPHLQLGQLQKPKEIIDAYLNDIKKPQTSPKANSVKPMRVS